MTPDNSERCDQMGLEKYQWSFTTRRSLATAMRTDSGLCGDRSQNASGKMDGSEGLEAASVDSTLNWSVKEKR